MRLEFCFTEFYDHLSRFIRLALVKWATQFVTEFKPFENNFINHQHALINRGEKIVIKDRNNPITVSWNYGPLKINVKKNIYQTNCVKHILLLFSISIKSFDRLGRYWISLSMQPSVRNRIIYRWYWKVIIWFFLLFGSKLEESK